MERKAKTYNKDKKFEAGKNGERNGDTMRRYYIDPEKGTGDGTSPEKAGRNWEELSPEPGDMVLFKRGSRIYGSLRTVGGTKERPVLYGAYGEGEKPVFCGCVDLSRKEAWRSCGNGIWECTEEVPAEACNFIFNGGEACGTMRWSEKELTETGDWLDSRAGTHECVEGQPEEREQRLLLYCEENPAERYRKIECATREYRELAHAADNVVIEDLVFEKNGVHGIAGSGENIAIRRCEIRLIGGCVWSRKLKIRFGNGVEFWDVSRNVSVTDNLFYDIYDSGVTHQGSTECQVTENAHFDRNVFIKCGMAAYEGRDLVPRGLTFHKNVCLDAGEGFSKNGVTMPRNSEIWPRPMGHHVFLWRMEEPTEGGSLQIAENVFGSSPYGAAVYSLASKEAEAQFEIDGNLYYAEKRLLLNRVGGKDYTSFEAYRAETGYDRNGRLETVSNGRITPREGLL